MGNCFTYFADSLVIISNPRSSSLVFVPMTFPIDWVIKTSRVVFYIHYRVLLDVTICYKFSTGQLTLGLSRYRSSVSCLTCACIFGYLEMSCNANTLFI